MSKYLKRTWNVTPDTLEDLEAIREEMESESSSAALRKAVKEYRKQLQKEAS
jgi:hypothetical protein